MTSGMTRRGIAERIRRLERRLGLSDIQLQGEQDAWPPMQFKQLCALLGKPRGPGQQETPPRPVVVLKDARLVRWLHQAYPERLRDLRQAHAAGEPAAPWRETSTRSTKRKRRKSKTASADPPLGGVNDYSTRAKRRDDRGDPDRL